MKSIMLLKDNNIKIVWEYDKVFCDDNYVYYTDKNMDVLSVNIDNRTYKLYSKGNKSPEVEQYDKILFEESTVTTYNPCKPHRDTWRGNCDTCSPTHTYRYTTTTSENPRWDFLEFPY